MGTKFNVCGACTCFPLLPQVVPLLQHFFTGQNLHPHSLLPPCVGFLCEFLVTVKPLPIDLLAIVGCCRVDLLMILWNGQDTRAVLAAVCHPSHPIQRELMAVENCPSYLRGSSSVRK